MTTQRTIPNGYSSILPGADVLYIDAQAHILDQMSKKYPAVMQKAIAKAVEKTTGNRYCAISFAERADKHAVPKDIRCSNYLLPDDAKFEILTCTQPSILKSEDSNGRRDLLEHISVAISRE